MAYWARIGGRELQQQATAAEKVAAKRARVLHSQLQRNATNTKAAKKHAAAKKIKAEHGAKRRTAKTQRKREKYARELLTPSVRLRKRDLLTLNDLLVLSAELTKSVLNASARRRRRESE
eukprot:6206584-Pleurochrysis_carterae.AAC.1